MKTTHSELNLEKFIVFTIADYRLALPIEKVVQIVNRPETTRELSKAGLVQMGRHVIQIFDLHHQLENGIDPGHRPFLVITYSVSEGFCAIPVSEPPNLVEFPPELMQALPPSHDRSSILSIASHAATLEMDRVPATIFLIDVKRMVASRSTVPDRAIANSGHNLAKEARQ
ncbi:chemotaxis protein CheW [Pseudanabaenaceae cyanobacterium LEGE 13415]|nr:chemotaxis protein CheW [Pseudanabaenaceae cyanobacterium LEGE 13415]